MSLLCSILKVSRSGFYKWLNKKILSDMYSEDADSVESLIRDVFNKHKGIYGYRRITTFIRINYNIIINHKKVYRIMKSLGLRSKVRAKKKFFAPLVEGVIIKDNILNRDFKATTPSSKLVTDITTIKYKSNKKLYLSAIMDLYNNEILTYKIGSSNNNDLVINTIIDTLAKNKLDGAILHSDRGIQYTSRLYNTILKENKIIQSMSRKGNCHDNACIESFFSHLKSECIYLSNYNSEEEVINSIDEYINFYNNIRFQKRLKKWLQLNIEAIFVIHNHISLLIMSTF
ncbi:IS3 family transposase [Clostridium tertium]|uniref:IS3 family transposase n=1 Tax=Clostridium tertium TaxID=1559 RepID=UPI002330F6DF|nr:IS3 family transposase [Clostridium tertium]MDB1921777.1 IS3 family transposase [Clostridium tertium]MDB1924979.1 IS3 family transposase [Clostridium tertium]MDB1929357.1 IS3 family transposase [Clostridium tertium]